MRASAALLTTAAAVAAAVAPARARAESLSAGSLDLDWRAPDGCPDGSAALQRIRSLLAASPEARERVTASATVAPGPTEGTWTLELSTAQGARSFQRSVRAGSCEEATEAGVLIIALAIDPDLKAPSAEPAEPTPAESPPPEAAPKPPPPAPQNEPKQVEVAPRDRREVSNRAAPERVAFELAAAVAADVGSLPRPALGAQGAVGIELLPIRLEALVSFFPPARETIASERGGDISLLSGGARGCYVARGHRFALAGCGGLEVGQISGSGFGTSWEDTRPSLWLAPRAGLTGSYAVSTQAALRAGLEGLVPLYRPEFILENVGPVHQPAAWVGRLELGFELLF